MKVLRKIFNFYVISAIIAVIACFVIHRALDEYKLYLADYEKTQPFYAIDEIMQTHFSNPDYAELAAKAPIKNISEFESLEDYQKFINDQLTGRDVVLRDESANKTFTDEHKLYTVLSGGIPFAEFLVKKNPQHSKYGFDIWELDCINALPLDFTPQNSISVSIVRGSTLYVNEKPVDEKYFVKEDKITESVEHMPDGVTGIIYDLYTINGLLNEPDINVIDKNSQPSCLNFDKRGVYVEEINYDIISDETNTLCTNALLAYSKYITNDGSLNELGQYFSRGTRIWQAISSSEVIWYTAHTGYNYKDISVSNYYCYDENTFSARVKATQYIFRGSSRTDIFDIDFIFYFARQEDGSFMVYDMVNYI